MLGTPCLDGRPEAFYMNSVLQTVALGAQRGVEIKPILLSYDAMIQRARNDIVRLALEGGFDDLLMIDDDEEWEAAQALALIDHPVDVVGAAVRKKADNVELYNVKANSPFLPVDPATGLWIADAIGTGFLRVSRRALEALWNSSEQYVEDSGKQGRMVFNVAVVGGRLWGEDTFMCEKLKRAGFKIHVDARFTVTHIGVKRYQGNFAAFVARLQQQAKRVA